MPAGTGPPGRRVVASAQGAHPVLDGRADLRPRVLARDRGRAVAGLVAVGAEVGVVRTRDLDHPRRGGELVAGGGDLVGRREAVTGAGDAEDLDGRARDVVRAVAAEQQQTLRVLRELARADPAERVAADRPGADTGGVRLEGRQRAGVEERQVERRLRDDDGGARGDDLSEGRQVRVRVDLRARDEDDPPAVVAPVGVITTLSPASRTATRSSRQTCSAALLVPCMTMFAYTRNTTASSTTTVTTQAVQRSARFTIGPPRPVGPPRADGPSRSASAPRRRGGWSPARRRPPTRRP